MRISVKVKPGSKNESVVDSGHGEFVVRVREKALDGRANKAAIALIGDHLGVPKSRISVIKGAHHRNKIIEII